MGRELGRILRTASCPINEGCFLIKIWDPCEDSATSAKFIHWN